jgi:hypothetical protein
MAEVVVKGEGAERKVELPALTQARDDDRPVLLYVGLGQRDGLDKKRRAQVAKARKFEKTVLDSKSAAKAAKGYVMLRLDLGDPDHAAFAKTLGVERAPALLLFVPGEEKHQDLGAKVTASSLAHKLKKHAP